MGVTRPAEWDTLAAVSAWISGMVRGDVYGRPNPDNSALAHPTVTPQARSALLDSMMTSLAARGRPLGREPGPMRKAEPGAVNAIRR